jgi:hypothetical protein
MPASGALKQTELADVSRPASGDAAAAPRRAAVARRLETDGSKICKIADAVLHVIDEELDRLVLPKASDAERSKEYHRYCNVLVRLRTGLTEIQSLIAEAAGEAEPLSRRSTFERAAVIVDQMGGELLSWVDRNTAALTAYGGNAAVLGIEMAFLTACGAPAEQAFPALAFLLGGPEFLQAFRSQAA